MEKRIAVLGAGTMGVGIAQLAAQHGFDVLMYDLKDEYVQRGLGNITPPSNPASTKASWKPARCKRPWGASSPPPTAMTPPSYDLIIEAAPESIDLKREIFADLGKKASPTTILATNTSSLSITSIAAASPHPERVVGMHFFNPAPVMPLVEVIAASQTSQDVVESVRAIAQSLGKTPVRASDTPGFIVNRVCPPVLQRGPQDRGRRLGPHPHRRRRHARCRFPHGSL